MNDSHERIGLQIAGRPQLDRPVLSSLFQCLRKPSLEEFEVLPDLGLNFGRKAWQLRAQQRSNAEWFRHTAYA